MFRPLEPIMFFNLYFKDSKNRCVAGFIKTLIRDNLEDFRKNHSFNEYIKLNFSFTVPTLTYKLLTKSISEDYVNISINSYPDKVFRKYITEETLISLIFEKHRYHGPSLFKP